MIYKRSKHWHLDVMINGVRYREALNTTDWREAQALEKKRVGEIQGGKGASKSGKEFARKPFGEAAKLFIEERKAHVAERTTQFERERLKPLEKYFGEKCLIRFKAEDIASYQRHRLQSVAARTINMEVSVLRRMLKRAKVWATIAEDVRMFPEHGQPVARVLTVEQKKKLFETAGRRPDWLVAHCAAVLAVSSTCRGVELKHLRWQDVDLFGRIMTIKRSKTAAGHRSIPLNADALAALARLLERAQAHGTDQPDHFVFPTCEHERLDPTRPQKSWRTAWRTLTKTAGVPGFRFHDLRHQAITEMGEGGAADATIKAVAGHMDQAMMEHYSHVRMDIKRQALDKLQSGLMGTVGPPIQQQGENVN